MSDFGDEDGYGNSGIGEGLEWVRDMLLRWWWSHTFHEGFVIGGCVVACIYALVAHPLAPQHDWEPPATDGSVTCIGCGSLAIPLGCPADQVAERDGAGNFVRCRAPVAWEPGVRGSQVLPNGVVVDDHGRTVDLLVHNAGTTTVSYLDPRRADAYSYMALKPGQTYSMPLDAHWPIVRVACGLPPEPPRVEESLGAAVCVDACRDSYGTVPTWHACDTANRRWGLVP